MANGSIMDVFAILLVVFGGCIVVLIFSLVITQITPYMNVSASTGEANVVGVYTTAQASSAMSVLSGGMLFISIGLGVVTIISAFLVKQYPFFFIFMILILIVQTVVAGQFVEAWHVLTTSSTDLTLESAKLPMLTIVMDALPVILLFTAFLVAIVSTIAQREG